MARKEKDPLAPLDSAVHVVLGLLVGLFALFLVLATLGDSVTLDGVGPHEVCLTTGPGQGVGYGGSDAGGVGDHPIGLHAGVRSFPTRIQICDESPSAGAVALGLSRALLGPLGGLGLFVLLRRLIRRARLEGFFADAIPGALLQVATFLLVWGIGSWVWGGIANNILLGTMAEHTSFLGMPRFPFTNMVVALGLVTLSRVMTHAVALREDVEATV